MSTEDNKAFLNRYFNSAWNQGNPAVIDEGDKVVTRITAQETHQGELQGIAPTGKPMTVTGIETMRVSGGKIVEGWVEFDQLGMLQQLGVIPAPGQTS